MTSPRTPPIWMRSPTRKILPEMMLIHPATAPITSCRAKASPALSRPSTNPIRPAKARQTSPITMRAIAPTTYRVNLRAL